ncbi:protein kinase domain-containing protein [Nocardia takedensis]
MALDNGTLFAGYRIERRLGAGGMGVVYLARHPRLPRSVALKVLDSGAGADPEFRARFEREAELAVRLDHPNVVEIYDRGDEDGTLWIAMRYVAGSDVAHLLAEHGPLPPRRALTILSRAADGLDAAHRRGLLHRDVKPANLLVGADSDGEDQVFVTDFGIARGADDGTALTASGSIVATLGYAAPEQIRGEDVDHRADVYALGITLFQMLTGTLPFVGPTPAAVLHAHLAEPPPRATIRNPALPPAVDQVLAIALAKYPDQRYDSCRALATAAAEALSPSAPRHGAGPGLPVHRSEPSSAESASLGPASDSALRPGGTPGPSAQVPRPDGHPGPGPATAQPWSDGQPSGAPGSIPQDGSATARPWSGAHQSGGAFGSTPQEVPGPRGPDSGSGVSGGHSGARPQAAPAGPFGSAAASELPARGAESRSAGKRLPWIAAAAAILTVLCLGAAIAVVRPEIITGSGIPVAEPSTTAAPTTASASTTTALPTTTPTVTAWGRANDLVALFPALLPATPTDTGYQGARCIDLNVLNNGGAPALECTQDNGIHYYVWSFRRDDPRRDQTFTTNIDNDTTRQSTWTRPSGSGSVRWSYYPGGNTGLLTVRFDDPARAWVVLDVGWDHHSGQDLFDQWWTTAPL